MTKITFANNSAPALSAANLNQMQTNIENAINERLPKTGGTITGRLTLDSGLDVKSEIELFGNAPYIDFHFNNTTTDYTSRLMETSSGLLTISNTLGLSVLNGNITTPRFITSAAGCQIYDDANGNLFFRTGNVHPIYCRSLTGDQVYVPVVASAFTQASSRRYKENIKDLTDDEANKILDINIVEFDYKVKENGTNMVGVIAEDVYEVLPNVVTMAEINGEDVPDSVDYSKFTPYILKKIQMQEEKIKEQDKKIADLERKIASFIN